MIEHNNSYFEKNLAVLEENHPAVFDIVSRQLDNALGIEVVEAQNKKLNLKVDISKSESVLIHDPSDPGKEADIFLSMVPENATGVVLMFGMGLGYSVIELLKRRKKIQHLVAFELNIPFFVQALRHMDLGSMLSDSRLIISLENPENLSNVMAPVSRALMLEDVHTLSLTTCFKANKAYEALSPAVADYISAFNAEGNTKLAHGRTFIENRLKHLTSMHHDRKLEDLDGKFKDFPALIVAAGPSLDKNIDQVQKAVGKAVIFCVDSALPVLLAKNIVPDFVTSIDFQELTWEKIAGVAANPACRNINLICTTWVTEFVPKRFLAKNVFWAYSRNALENWINSMMGGTISIGGAGTVAHLNFVSANLMGCNPIIFAGQDLAFSNRKGHSTNVVLSSDAWVKQQLETGHDILWVKGAVEEKVPTNRQMHGYRQTFERMIRESDNCVVNATEGGAFIDGAEHMSMAHAVEKYCKKEISVEIEDTGERVGLFSPVESALKEISKADRIVKKAEKISGPVHKKLMQLEKGTKRISSFADLPEALQKKISDLDACHKKADNMPLFSLFDEMTMEGLRQNEREQKAIAALEGSSENYFEWLLRSVLRIDKINKLRMKNLAWLKKQLTEIVGYYEKERSHLKKIKENIAAQKNIFDLAQLYFETGNFVLLDRLLAEYGRDRDEFSALDYYDGVLSLYHGAYETAETRFQKAVDNDEAYTERIIKGRKEISEYYWNQVRRYKGLSAGVRNPFLDRLLLKGLRIWPEHKGIIDELGQVIGKDLEKAKQVWENNETKQAESAGQQIRFWCEHLSEFSGLPENLGHDLLCNLYSSQGRLLMHEQDYENALAAYNKARSLAPEDPDIYISMADTCFSAEDFDRGVGYLKSAVDLNPGYGMYWNNMGDNLMQRGDYGSAILAFEQCFMALPETIDVLKKIGNCYTRLGNLEAAREALEQYKKRLIDSRRFGAD